MERVLSCVELLNLIFSDKDIDKKSLTRCVRVCGTWFATAAPILWRSLDDVEVLFRLLPMVKRGKNDLIIYEALSETDWERFNVYVKFVKRLRFRLDSKNSYAKMVHSVLSILAYKDSVRCLAPNMDELELHYDDANYLDSVFFLGARLRHLIIRELCDSASLYNTLHCILLQASCITSLLMECSSTIDTTPFDKDFRLAFGMFSALKELTLCDYKLTSDVLQSLASLPILESFTYKGSGDVEYGHIEGKFGHTARAFGVPFPQLKEITFASPMPVFSYFLSMDISMPTVEKLHVEFLEVTTEDKLQRCSEKVAQHFRNLLELRFILRLLIDSPVLHFSAIKALSGLRKIRSFRLFSVGPLSITDEEMGNWTKEWPHLNRFSVLTPLEITCYVKPKLSLSSLVSFANNCPHIKYLVLFVDGLGEKSFKIPPNTPILKHIQHLGFQCSPISQPDAIAFELSTILGPFTRISVGYRDSRISESRNGTVLQTYKNDWLRVVRSLKLISEVTKRQSGLVSEGMWNL